MAADELIAKDFRMIQSSRRGYQPCGKRDWIDAIKKIDKQGGSGNFDLVEHQVSYDGPYSFEKTTDRSGVLNPSLPPGDSITPLLIGGVVLQLLAVFTK